MYASERSERARNFSYFYLYTNAISMQLLTITNNNHEWYIPQKKGALFFQK